jgi:hypothetical protein
VTGVYQRKKIVSAEVYPLSGFASAADSCGSLDRVVIAIRLTRVLYPEGKE